MIQLVWYPVDCRPLFKKIGRVSHATHLYRV